MKIVAIIVAGGSSNRFGDKIPKQFQTVANKPLLSHTIGKFEQATLVDKIIVVVAEEFLIHTAEKIIDPYDFKKVEKVVIGGKTRQESVKNGLDACHLGTEYVAIHDGARPLVSINDINHVIEIALGETGAILAKRTTDTVKRVKDDYIISTPDRAELFQAQTPQVFQYKLIKEAHVKFSDSENITDDASLLENLDHKIKIVEATSPNFKITTKDDLKLAELLMKGN
jgi:2-C-methyl-D-erythritol 4-phosphate cytidylyltransferase